VDEDRGLLAVDWRYRSCMQKKNYNYKMIFNGISYTHAC
jgi:hypothetical protein